MRTGNETEWQEFSWKDAPAMPAGPHKKLRLYADANVPAPIVAELRNAGLTVLSAQESGYARLPDEDISHEARRRKCVLLTMDGDFWDDRKHPLQDTDGIIFVDVPPDQLDRAVDGLARFYSLFAKWYPLDWWKHMKARVTEFRFAIRTHTWEGKVSQDEFWLSGSGKLLTKSVR